MKRFASLEMAFGGGLLLLEDDSLLGGLSDILVCTSLWVSGNSLVDGNIGGW